MNLHRPLLVSLALLAGVPLGSALVGGHAGAAWGRDGRARYHMARHASHPKRHGYLSAAVVLPEDASSTLASVGAELESDAGSEAVDLLESNAWLHGSAALVTLPTRDASFELTTYSVTGELLRTLTGIVSPTGTIIVDGDSVAGSDGDCTSRVGCDASDPEAADVEVLAAELVPTASGHDLSLDLQGADVYDVAYATLVVTESDEVTTCDKVSGECTTTGSSTTTKAEVDWEETGSVWQADLTLPHEGLIEFKVKTYDARGKKIESLKAKLGAPWVGEGDGANSLAIDEDPLTSVALYGNGGSAFSNHSWGLAIDLAYSVVSEGWSATDKLPVEAKVELADGTTAALPVQSYQRRPAAKGAFWSVGCAREYSWSGFVPLSVKANGAVFEGISFDDLEAPICADGTCIVLTDNDDGTCTISATAYGDDASGLPDSVDLVVTELGPKGEPLSSESLWIELEDELVAVFEGDILFSGDPVGVDLDGKVSLLGAANKKGKQETLSKGKFYSTIARDADGDLGLTGADKDRDTYRGDLVVKLQAPDGKAALPGGTPAVAAVQFGEGWARIALVSRL